MRWLRPRGSPGGQGPEPKQSPAQVVDPESISLAARKPASQWLGCRPTVSGTNFHSSRRGFGDETSTAFMDLSFGLDKFDSRSVWSQGYEQLLCLAVLSGGSPSIRFRPLCCWGARGGADAVSEAGAAIQSLQAPKFKAQQILWCTPCTSKPNFTKEPTHPQLLSQQPAWQLQAGATGEKLGHVEFAAVCSPRCCRVWPWGLESLGLQFAAYSMTRSQKES